MQNRHFDFSKRHFVNKNHITSQLSRLMKKQLFKSNIRNILIFVRGHDLINAGAIETVNKKLTPSLPRRSRMEIRSVGNDD
jgi:hypothetical protein